MKFSAAVTSWLPHFHLCGCGTEIQQLTHNLTASMYGSIWASESLCQGAKITVCQAQCEILSRRSSLSFYSCATVVPKRQLVH